MFVYFYLWDAGISQTPWDDPRIFVIASGDDVIVFVLKNIAQDVYDAILQRTARNTGANVVGLG